MHNHFSTSTCRDWVYYSVENTLTISNTRYDKGPHRYTRTVALFVYLWRLGLLPCREYTGACMSPQATVTNIYNPKSRYHIPLANLINYDQPPFMQRFYRVPLPQKNTQFSVLWGITGYKVYWASVGRPGNARHRVTARDTFELAVQLVVASYVCFV